MLCDQQVERYSRQIILPEVGAHGQERLLSASLALVDAGGEPSLLLLYLAAAGVGRIVIHDLLGRAALALCAREAAELNPDCEIELHSCEPRLESDRFAMVVLAEGGGAARTQLALACARRGTPLVWACSHGAIGYVGTAAPGTSAGCYACAAPALDFGDLQRPPVAPLVASIQAIEAIRLALAIDSSSSGGIVRVDAAAGKFAATHPPRRPGCLACVALQAQ